MEDLRSRIAELKQIIAEQEAYQRSPYNKYHYGHIWDAIAGDRSGLDAEAADEAAYRNMILQQKFQAEQNELNRQNAKDIAAMSRTNANEAKLDAIEKELNSLVITKQTLDAQGKDSRDVTARIEQIYKNYPAIQRPHLPEYDPETDVNYVLAKSGEMNYMDNNGDNELEDMLEMVKNYRTPEAAKERVRLEREIIKRNKAKEFQEQLNNDITNYWKTGIMSDLMLELGFEEAGIAGNRHLIQGKKIHRRPKKKGGNPAPAAPTDT